MCGIAGKVTSQPSPSLDSSTLANAVSLLKHRGPDDSGIWTDYSSALVHTRLSIIDTSSGGHQPMTSACKRFVIVFNGEIYNYRELRDQLTPPENGWRSSSDTEVLLQAYIHWGEDCLQQLKGMFAFAIFDTLERRLFIARDRLGIKPLYYYADSEQLAFASRPTALLALMPNYKLDIDNTSAALFLCLGFIPGSHSIYQGIQRLAPGNSLSWNCGQLETRCYWGLESIVEASGLRSTAALVDEGEKLLDQSVRRHLVSDVNVGAFLSGGLDSSLMLALMTKNSTEKFNTFTLGFANTPNDESAYAEAVARYFNTAHHRLLLNAKQLLNYFPKFLEVYDEPLADSSALPLLAISDFASKHVKVVISGDGGDEIFGGYRYHRIQRALGVFYTLPQSLRRKLFEPLGKSLPRSAGNFFRALCYDTTAGALGFARSSAKNDPTLMLHCDSLVELAVPFFESVGARFSKQLSSAGLAMRLDAAIILPDDYLVKVDVASMAYGLEVRPPLLDHQLVEWALGVHSSRHLALRTGKRLLREIVYRYIPRNLIDRPKRGFGVPLKLWLRSDLREWSEELISNAGEIDQLGLDPSVLKCIWSKFLKGDDSKAQLVWSTIVLLAFKERLKTRDFI